MIMTTGGGLNMIESITETVPELLYTVLAGGLTVVGVLAETASMETISGGETAVGLWMAAIGLVALYAGFKLAREKSVLTV
ncbi:putative membrane protein [Halapricum desulfuricans]|uniref:Putative membrane protein n=2 Tax=Halapricum desulfuricans TaxID=2841257 RepID=A0A897N4V2_9EURY|nr:putative membrane protein [Halapricum desulfuricans]